MRISDWSSDVCSSDLAFGWFKKPVTKTADLKGLKFRTNGLAIDLFTAMGAAVNALPGGEIVPALDRGLLDGAEFNNATSDRLLGFPDVSKVDRKSTRLNSSH